MEEGQCISELAKRLQEEGLRVEAKVRYSYPVAEILDRLIWNYIDLIAMATHSRTGLTRVIMGSIAEHVLRRTPVPLLL